MGTTLVLASMAERLWSHPRPGDLVQYPFRNGRVRKVVEVFPNGDVGLEEADA